MEIFIAGFSTSFYIPEIQKLVFHLPHVCILGTNNCGNTRREAFKRHSPKQCVLCRRDYAEILVASFANQIQSEYYGRNITVSIEGIALEHFSAPTHTEIEVTPQVRTRHAVFHSFFSDASKQYSSTTTAHRKCTIKLLK